MKILLRLMALSILTIGTSTHAQNGVFGGVDETDRFIFYSVLEGLYEDGVAIQDVDRILMKKEGYTYFHFIYGCPVCNATIWAMEAYHGRPPRFYGRKTPMSATFGGGLSDSLHAQLYSDDSRERLSAINTLVKTWIERRMTGMNLSKEDREKMVGALEEKRKAGMRMLEQWRRDPFDGKNRVAEDAPAYVDLQECAVCNGVVGKPMKMPDAKPK